MKQDTASLNAFWAFLMIEELVRNDVTQFFVAPGSRSTPLTVAIARHPEAQAILHYDERSLAYAALGYARATGKPAVWVTTSGTAVANGLPAVVEASNDRVPLLCLTADRPPELRDTDANQAIDQVQIFGKFVRWFSDLPCPSAEIEPAFVLSSIDHALGRMRSERGPVHLNCQFREPFLPEMPAPMGFPSSLTAWRNSQEGFDSFQYAYPQITQIRDLLEQSERGLIVVARLDPYQVEVVDWLEALGALGWPILADLGSQLRFSSHPNIIHHFDQLLLSPFFTGQQVPDTILQIGSRFTSKRLGQWLKTVRPRHYIVVKDHPFRSDPNHQVTMSVETNLAAFVYGLTEKESGLGMTLHPETAWLNAWQRANEVVAKTIDTELVHHPKAEWALARTLSRLLPHKHGLFLGNSMPIRDWDMYAAMTGGWQEVGANRGASGIDGLVAAAAGFAVGLEKPVTLVLGDLSFLYDLNALLILKRIQQPVTVVVINNDGGGIFSFLPIAQVQDVFEPFFGTPHGLSFEAAAALFQLPYAQATTIEDFQTAYQHALAEGVSTLIEFKSNRPQNLQEHQALQQRIKEALAAIS